jgi:hypothetical protein
VGAHERVSAADSDDCLIEARSHWICAVGLCYEILPMYSREKAGID